MAAVSRLYVEVGRRFRHAVVLVADAHHRRVGGADDHQDGGQADGDQGRPAPRHPRKARPQRRQTAVALQGCLALPGMKPDVGEQHRQKAQVGEDDGGDAEAGGDGDFLDHRHLDERDGHEAHGVGSKRHGAGQQQAAQAVARGRQRLGTRNCFGAHRADHLHAVADPDGEHQEGHEDGDGVDAEAEADEGAELPDHRNQGAGQQHGGEAQGAGVDVDEQGRDRKGDDEEQHHAHGARGDVAHHLGEADDVQIRNGVVAARLGADAFELRGDVEVVELRPGVGIEFLQLGADQGAGEVAGDQTPDDAGLDDVLAHLRQTFFRRLEIRRQHVAAHQAVLDHLDEAHVGGEDGIDLGAIDAGQEEHRVRHLAQQGEELGREHIAVARHHRHGHAVGAAEFVAIFEEGLHVLVFDWQQLGEAGVHAQPGGQPRQRHRRHREDGEGHNAAAEDQTIDKGGDGTFAFACRCFRHHVRLFDFGEGFDAGFPHQHDAAAAGCQRGRYALP